MEKYIVFGILSLPVIILSWHTLFKVNSHGFYRFFSWECIAFLLAFNYPYWFKNPFSISQLFSWVFLVIGGYLVIAGVVMLKKFGKSGKERDENSLYQFEKTTELVEQGIFKYIRHPLYSSLLFLAWGILLKNSGYFLCAVAILSSLFLYLTAINDEKECIRYFGDKYRDYMKRSRMFIPFLF